MDVALFIARRLHLNVDGRRRSPSVGIAVSGIAIAVVVMMLTIAIVTGFKSQITDKVMGFDAQITLTPLAAEYQREVAAARLDEPLEALLRQALPDGAVVSLAQRQPAVLKTDGEFEAVVFEAYSNTADYDFIRNNIVAGVMPGYGDAGSANDIVISSQTASRLSLSVGDRISTFFFGGERLRLRKLTVAAIYDTGFGEYDRVVSFAGMGLLQRIGGLGEDTAQTIRVSGLDNDAVTRVTDELNTMLSSAYYNGVVDEYYVAQSIYRSRPSYFSWLELLDANVLVILILMGCVSGFTLVSCLFILILERVRMIGILKALGADDRCIRRVFIYLAVKVILTGIVIGDVVAAALMWLQSRYHIIKLDADAYCLSYVPVDAGVSDLLTLNVVVIVVAVVLLLLPSHIVSRISPATTMRYE